MNQFNRFLLLTSLAVFQTNQQTYNDYIQTVRLKRRQKHGDVFGWNGDCGVFNAVREPWGNVEACSCQMVGTDGTTYAGTLYGSSTGVYSCYYDMGEMAGASLTAAGNFDCDSQQAQIPLRTNGSSPSLVTKRGSTFTASNLAITKVERFTYQSQRPFSVITNPFYVHAHSSSGNSTDKQTFTWKLRHWSTVEPYRGDLLRLSLISTHASNHQNHSLLLRIGGERQYRFEDVKVADPSTLRDYVKVRNDRDEYLKAMIGLVVVCGLLLLVLIVILLVYCCRRCKRRGQKKMETITIQTPEVQFVPAPRRDKSPLPPRPPERYYEGLNTTTADGRMVPSQCLYEATDGLQDYDELQTPNTSNSTTNQQLYVDPRGNEELYIEPNTLLHVEQDANQPVGVEPNDNPDHVSSSTNEGYYDNDSTNQNTPNNSCSDKNVTTEPDDYDEYLYASDEYFQPIE